MDSTGQRAVMPNVWENVALLPQTWEDSARIVHGVESQLIECLNEWMNEQQRQYGRAPGNENVCGKWGWTGVESSSITKWKDQIEDGSESQHGWMENISDVMRRKLLSSCTTSSIEAMMVDVDKLWMECSEGEWVRLVEGWNSDFLHGCFSAQWYNCLSSEGKQRKR